MSMHRYYKDFLIRSWKKDDRILASEVIRSVLAEYGLGWEADGADRDVIQVEECYLNTGGEFWVVEQEKQIVGTAAYYPIKRGENAVEIRKMYLLPHVRGLGLGKYLLQQLEQVITSHNYREIWIETASILTEAVKLYESNGYIPATGVETARCDCVYVKKLSKSSNELPNPEKLP
jgi:putative acetyltransferase